MIKIKERPNGPTLDYLYQISEQLFQQRIQPGGNSAFLVTAANDALLGIVEGQLLTALLLLVFAINDEGLNPVNVLAQYLRKIGLNGPCAPETLASLLGFMIQNEIRSSQPINDFTYRPDPCGGLH